ncbi:MAG: hypothetical protein KBI16_00625 [Clostridia bacterium]|nr:hypothetical protein [Clostridia bacterium]
MTSLKKRSKIIFVIVIMSCVLVTFLCTGFVKATARPTVRIGNISNCSQGDSISFSVEFSGNNLVNGGRIPFNASYVTVHGFSANVGVIKNTYSRYTVTLNNVRGNSSGNYVEIRSGAAIANDGLGSAYSATTYSNSFSIGSNDTVAPSISLIGPNISSANNGGTVTYIVRYTDASGVANVNLYQNSVKLKGFTANVSISGSGENSKVVERKITLSNIQGSNGSKYISIVAATASDYNGNRTIGVNSSPFKLVNRGAVNSSGSSSSSGQNSNGNGDQNNDSASEETKEENNEENKDKPVDWVPNPKTGKY